jgi:D-beta-D-heptose 7-phosphate kinase/D-beta-D-heptose 1-phosphate adenosyltransferase
LKENIRKKEDLRRIVDDLKKKGKRVVFTNGCFDLIHLGHIRCLEKAKSLGDILVVGVNSDRSVRGLKGPERPILQEEDRAEILSGLGCVDYVIIFDEPTPLELISSLHPDVLAKGGNWAKEATVGREVVERSGGEVVILPFVEGNSTSNIIETILKRFLKKPGNL